MYDLGAPQLFFVAITCSNHACECMYKWRSLFARKSSCGAAEIT